MLDLYKNIKARREELGLTQAQLAEKIGYADKTMVSKIEKGSVDLSQSKISTIAEALKTTPAKLMGWEDTDSSIVHTDGQDEVYKSGDVKNEIVVSDKDNRFSIHFRDGKTMSDTDKELLKEQIATTIDSFYKLRGIE